MKPQLYKPTELKDFLIDFKVITKTVNYRDTDQVKAYNEHHARAKITDQCRGEYPGFRYCLINRVDEVMPQKTR